MAPEVAQVTAQAEQGRLNRMAEAVRSRGKTIMAIGLAALAGFGINEWRSGGSSGNNKEAVAAAASAVPTEPACDSMQLGNTAFQYPQKFLPPAKGGIGDETDASNYTKSLFSAQNVLGGKADTASLAMVDAVFLKPALSTATNNSYSYSRQFEQSLQRLRNPATARAAGKQICEAAWVVLGSTEKYDESAITKGQDFTTLAAVDGKTRITDMKLERHTATGNIEGVTYKVRVQDQTVEINGKTRELNGSMKTVVIEKDGTVDIIGVLPIEKNGRNQKQAKRGKGGQKARSQRNGRGGGASGNVGQGRGLGTGPRGTSPVGGGNSLGEQNANRGPQESLPKGNIPSRRPGPAQGRPNGIAPAQPGPGPSPSGGGGTPPPPPPSGGGETPPPSGGGGTPPPPPPSGGGETPPPSGGGNKGSEPPADCANNPNDPRC